MKSKGKREFITPEGNGPGPDPFVTLSSMELKKYSNILKSEKELPTKKVLL
jgi:hypothetical protein